MSGYERLLRGCGTRRSHACRLAASEQTDGLLWVKMRNSRPRESDTQSRSGERLLSANASHRRAQSTASSRQCPVLAPVTPADGFATNLKRPDPATGSDGTAAFVSQTGDTQMYRNAAQTAKLQPRRSSHRLGKRAGGSLSSKRNQLLGTPELEEAAGVPGNLDDHVR